MRIDGFTNSYFTAKTQALSAYDDSFKITFKQALKGEDDKKLKEACQQLEAVFLFQVIKAMRSTVPNNPLMGSSYGMDVFRSMLDEEYAKLMAAQGTAGLGDLIYRQLTSASFTTENKVNI